MEQFFMYAVTLLILVSLIILISWTTRLLKRVNALFRKIEHITGLISNLTLEHYRLRKRVYAESTDILGALIDVVNLHESK